jgi:hypothetical protein
MTLPKRIFHVERLARYKTEESCYRVFEETPAGLRPLVNDNGRDGVDGITYPFQTCHWDRHKRAAYQFAVPCREPAFDLLCRALADHFGEPIGVYRFGMVSRPVQIYEPARPCEKDKRRRPRRSH